MRKNRSILLAIVSAVALAGCSNNPARAPDSGVPADAGAAAAVDAGPNASTDAGALPDAASFVDAAMQADSGPFVDLDASAPRDSGPSPDGGTPVSTITITDTSGQGQSGRPVSVPRPFVRGEIAHCPQAIVDGAPVLTQADVKNRWPDGSVKFAILSFIVPSLTDSPATIAFQDQADCHNDGALSAQQLLDPAFDFEVQLTLTGAATRTVSARAMLTSGNCTPWLQGPIVTACIIEDRTPARAFDTNTDGAATPGGAAGNPLHPIFEAWFYPATHHVDVGATVENAWISSTKANSLADQDYALSILQGQAAPATCYSQGSFTHIGFTRWRRPCSTGTPHGSIHVDFNAPYVIGTRLVANYDTRHAMTEAMLQSVLAGWGQVSKNIEGSLTDHGCGGTGCVGLYEMEINGTGQHSYVGLNTKWDVLYLLSMDERLRGAMLGNADLAGRMPIFAREADQNAGTGQFFDAPCAGCGKPPTPVVGSVATFGRPMSINARQQASLVTNYWTAACSGNAPDLFKVGTVTAGGVSGINADTSHAPDMFYLPYLFTGTYYYLEGLQMQAAFSASQRNPCYTASKTTYAALGRQGRWGLAYPSTSIRAQGWAFRTMAYAAAISPDGTPEQPYFDSKLKDQIAEFEGGHGLAGPAGTYGADADKADVWAFGNTQDGGGGILWTGSTAADDRGPSPIGSWRSLGSSLVQAPLATTGAVAQATSPWEESFLTAALGVARDLGWATDELLKYEARRYFRLALDPSFGAPFLLEAFREPTVMTAAPNAWIADGATYLSAFTSVPTSFEPFGTVVMQDSHAYEAKSAISFMTSFSVDGFSGADAWQALDSGPQAIPNSQWLYDYSASNGSPVWSLRPRASQP